jgi:hypothetical protein
MKTAVEWFAEHIQEQLNVFLPGAVLDEIMLNKAKEMEKQKMIDFANEYGTYLLQGGTMTAGTYNETFKSE